MHGRGSIFLLDHWADINATMPERESEFDGYTLLPLPHRNGPRYSEYGEAYADALYLLERGADPNRAAADGMTFPKMLMKHRQQFRAGKRTPPESRRFGSGPQTHGSSTGRNDTATSMLLEAVHWPGARKGPERMDFHGVSIFTPPGTNAYAVVGKCIAYEVQWTQKAWQVSLGKGEEKGLRAYYWKIQG